MRFLFFVHRKSVKISCEQKEDPAKKRGMKGYKKDQKKYFEKNEKRG